MVSTPTEILLQELLQEQRKTNEFLEEIRDGVQETAEEAEACASAMKSEGEKIRAWFPIFQKLLATLDK